MKERERDAHAVEIGNGIDIFTRRSPDEIAERLEQLRQWRAEELENRRRLEELYDNPPSPDDVEDGYWDEHDHPRDYRRPPDPGEWLDAERDLDRMWNALELAAKHEPRFAERFRIIRSRVGRQ